jgi:hypothetical protein
VDPAHQRGRAVSVLTELDAFPLPFSIEAQQTGNSRRLIGLLNTPVPGGRP